jgi:hypothetical protein
LGTIEELFRIQVAEEIAQQIELAGNLRCRKHPLLMIWICEIGLLLRWGNFPVADAQNYDRTESQWKVESL